MKARPSLPALTLYAVCIATLATCGPRGATAGAPPPATYQTDVPSADAPSADAPSADVPSADAPSADAPATIADSAARSPDGAATSDSGPAAQTCAGRCGSSYHPSLPCQCNDVCGKYGNCCPDWAALCAPALLSCAGRCEAPYSSALPCQCHPDCLKKGTCCADYAEACSKIELGFLKAKPGECEADASWRTVTFTKDGDTIVVGGGDIVRLLVVNTPELSTEDCYAKEAWSFTRKKMKAAGIVCLIADPNQPDKDVYGRLLRYVYYKDPAANYASVQLNARLVRLGYGRVFYPWAKGNLYEQEALLMQSAAKGGKVGGWGACKWE